MRTMLYVEVAVVLICGLGAVPLRATDFTFGTISTLNCDGKIPGNPTAFGVTSFSFVSTHAAQIDPTHLKNLAPATLGDVVVTKVIDRCSPDLFVEMAQGIVLPNVKFSWTNSDTHLTWLTITLENAQVTADNYSLANESVSFSWTRITIHFVITKDDGTAGGVVERSWNRLTNSQ